MHYRKDLIGERYNFLKVINYNKETKKWVCQCNCGNVIEIETSVLKSGRKKSCGCQTYIRQKTKYPKLQSLYRTIKFKKEDDWGNWENFLEWALKNGYGEILSHKKIIQKNPYSKENLIFGIRYNKKFLPIKEAKIYHIFYNKETNRFNISFKYNKIVILKQDIITVQELCAQHIYFYNRYFHKKSFFE